MMFALDCAAKTTLILALALAAMRLSRRKSAAFRHWVLCVAIVCAALLPAFNLVLPSWRIIPIADSVSPPTPTAPPADSESQRALFPEAVRTTWLTVGSPGTELEFAL